MIRHTRSQAELRPAEATRGSRPDATPERRRMVLRECRPVPRNTLRGFCCVELPSGLVVRDISIHQKAGRWWASLPARPVLDAEGRQVRNHAAHAQYAALLGWRDRDLADRFSGAVVELVRLAHPDALDGEAGR
ncbi:MAG TPA: hypothetical protein VGF39_02105 [Stellaceae bacterium]